MPSLQQRKKQVRQRVASISWDILLPFVPGVSPLHMPASPVPSLLNTNHGPTDEQARLVREAVVKTSKEKTRLEAQFDAKLAGGHPSAAWVAAMKHKISRTGLFVKQHEAVLSPIKRLPVEILQEIFQCCAGHISTFSASCALETVPWSVGQVCRTWRTIALKTPTLWNVIPPGPLSRATRRTFVQLEAIVELLRRSGTAPLHVFLYCEVPLTRHPVVDILVKHSQRWKLFSFEGPGSLFSTLYPIRMRLPFLEILKLRTTCGSPKIDYFKIAPRLHTVSITEVDLSELCLPLHQLKHYRERLVFKDLWVIALSSQNSTSSLNQLTTLDLANLTLAQPLTLPNLTRLTLRCRTHSYSAPSLPLLTLPSIEVIRISASGESLVEVLAEMVLNSASSRPDGLSTLQGLYYRDQSFRHPPPGVVSRLLQSTPRLRLLDAPLPSSYDMKEIACSMNRQPVPSLPQLESCKFFMQQGSGYSCMEDGGWSEGLTALASVVTDRNSSNYSPPLRNLSLYFSQATCGPDLDRKLNNHQATDESSALDKLNNDLLEGLVTLRCGLYWYQRAPPDEEDVGWVREKLRLINEYEITTENVEAVYRSGIQFALKQISECEIDGTACISNAAQAILDKWQSTFTTSLHLRQWAFRGRYELIFIPPDDPIRTSDKALDLVYELRPVPPIDFESCL